MEVISTVLSHYDVGPQMMFNVMLGYWMWRTERRVFKIEQWLKFHIEKTET